jgi:hypothetical protein
MRNISWKIIVIMMVILLCNSSSFAEGPSGWLNMNYNNTEQFEDGKKTSTSDSFFQNYYLRFDKTITPMLSYQLYFRTSLTDSHLRDSEGHTADTYQRAMEPALDIALRNPMYGLNAGYRRTERWSTAHLRNESRGTTEFYYSRLNITPYKFPSLSLQFDRQGNYDHLATRKTDNTTTGYSGNSSYALTYNDLRLSYGITYTRNINETPIGIISKSINDSLNGMYSLGYSKSFWSGRVNVSAGYQGNYGRNKSTQFVTRTGSLDFKRPLPLPWVSPTGWYDKDAIARDITQLSLLDSQLTDVPPNALSDDPAYTTTTVINVGSNAGVFYNIGIQFSSPQNVKTLYIYVKSAINPGSISWDVYKSDTNITWTRIASGLNVSPTPFDLPNNIYRYILNFPSDNALYFKAVNLTKSSLSNNVFVTEIEAYGTDEISQTGELTDVTTFFTQGLNLNANLKATNRLSFSFNYFINKADQNPESIVNSMSGIFANIFSKSKGGQEEKMRSNITRSYGATSTWMAHRLLTTILRLQRSEAFDNKGETDFSSNTYSLAFSSSPLPTLDTNLSLIRSESYSFDEKQSVNNSYLLSIGSRLYTNVNMITDMGYTQSKSYATDTQSSARYISGALDARLTRKLYGSLTYGFSWTSSGSTSSSSKDGGVILSYNLSRLVNFSGNFRISDTGGIRTTSEGFLVDWLPLPVVRLNLNYQHSTSKPDPLVSDSLSGYGIWYIMKFMDVRITYSYTLNKDEKKTETYNTETYNLGGNLTCRFW